MKSVGRLLQLSARRLQLSPINTDTKGALRVETARIELEPPPFELMRNRQRECV
jgi:hypothetical protein